MLSTQRPFQPLPVGKNLALVVAIFVGIVACLLLLSNVRSEILSAVRSYVGGEGAYSKGQKDAVYYLIKYAHSHADADYQKYLHALAIPLGDRDARIELEKPEPDLGIAYRGFIQGRNHPDDVEGLASFFRRFRHISYMARAIDAWTHADDLVLRLRALGDELHSAAAAGTANPERTAQILDEIDIFNDRLTTLEHEFSRTLGEGNRWLERRLLQFTYAATALLLLTGIIVSSMIIRGARNADQMVRAQAERWRVTLASIGDGVLVTDANTTIVSLNSIAESLTGWTEADAIGKSLEEVFRISADQPAKSIGHPARQALRDGVIVGLGTHAILIAKDGTAKPIDDSVAPIKDHDGKIVGVVLVFRDVTERRRAEEQTLSQARQHEAIAHVGAIALSGRDLPSLMDAAVGYVTRTLGTDLCEILELPPEGHQLRLRAGAGWKAGAVGRASVHAAADSHAGYTLNSVAPVIIADFSTETRFFASPLLQEHRAVSGMSVVIGGEGGRHHGVLGTYTTHRRQFTRDEVNFLYAVANVLAEAIQRKRAEEALLEASREKDQFLAMLAHELRNPLSPIRNAVHVLRLADLQEPRLERACAMIDRQVGHMTRLVDDLLDVSRVARGRISLRDTVVDFKELVAATAEDYRGTLDGTGLSLTLILPEHPVWVRGDPTRLSQVVGNMLHNAHKFTDPGGHVTIELSPELHANAVTLNVRDTGIGIEPELLDRVFESFMQADHSLDRSRGGLGLGLALVKGLVEMHGGSVRAHSLGLGKGAQFTVRLPLTTEPTWVDVAPPSATVTQRSRRVLVIEDNIDAADSMKTLLEVGGHEVTVAYTGPAGLEAAHRFRPEVVFCDIGLPSGLDGYGVARAMRADPTLNSAYLIALTGYGQEEDRRLAAAVGFNLHLVKPVDPATLGHILATLPAQPREA